MFVLIAANHAAPVGLTALAVPIVLGLIAVYLLLPRVPHPSRWIGRVCAAGAVLTTGSLFVRSQVLSVETILFTVFALIAIVAGGMLVTQRNPVHAALSFALVVLSTCGLFLLQAAPFLMAATIIVYAGAIVVTFLFVIMLAQQEGPSDADYRSREPEFTCVAAFVLLGALLYVLQWTYHAPDVDALLARIEQARNQETAADIDAALDMPRFIADATSMAESRGKRIDDSFKDAFWNIQMNWGDWKDKNDAMAMRHALNKLMGSIHLNMGEGAVMVRPDPRLPLSPYSGTPSNTLLREAPRDKHGRATMPAANVAGLGRSLFTDYLVPVELAGTLLLVATIGAIAIASRPKEGLR